MTTGMMEDTTDGTAVKSDQKQSRTNKQLTTQTSISSFFSSKEKSKNNGTMMTTTTTTTMTTTTEIKGKTGTTTSTTPDENLITNVSTVASTKDKEEIDHDGSSKKKMNGKNSKHSQNNKDDGIDDDSLLLLGNNDAGTNTTYDIGQLTDFSSSPSSTLHNNQRTDSSDADKKDDDDEEDEDEDDDQCHHQYLFENSYPTVLAIDLDDDNISIFSTSTDSSSSSTQSFNQQSDDTDRPSPTTLPSEGEDDGSVAPTVATDAKKSVETDLYVKAQDIITNAAKNGAPPTPDELQDMYSNIDELFSTDKNGDAVHSSGKSSRWKDLFKGHVKEGMNHLMVDLKEARDNNADNKGNRMCGPGKALTNDEKRDIEHRVIEMVELHRPQGTETKGSPFWIPSQGNNKQTPPADGTWCVKREVKFPKKYEVYTCIGYDGLYKRLEDKPSNRTVKNNTSHIVVTNWPQFRMVYVKCRDNNTGVKVRDEDGKLWHLVYLEKKEGYEEIEDDHRKQPTQTQMSISSFFSLNKSAKGKN